MTRKSNPYKVMAETSEINLGLLDFEWRDSCPACGSVERSKKSAETFFLANEVVPAGKAIPLPDVKARRHLYECACGLWYFNLVPTRGTLEKLSESEAVRGRWSDEHRAAFARTYPILDALFPSGGTILDVGAHTAGFLRALPNTWKRFALEPCSEALPTEPTIEIVRAYLEDKVLESDFFDCVVAFDVFEHFSSPELAVGEIARSLKVGGLLILETGTTEAHAATWLKAGWYYLNYLEHFQVFNQKSLSQLLDRYGLHVSEIRRVSHDKSGSLSSKIRTALFTAGYGLLTGLGRRPELWLGINSFFRPGRQAFPPVSIAIDSDHTFLVARKGG